MRYYCHQLYEDDCGFASLKMLLAYTYHSKSYLNIPNPREKGRYSMFELQSYGRTYGILLKGYNISINGLKGEVNFPCIALTSIDGIDHFVVILKANSKKVVILDPSKGCIKYDLNAF